MKKNIYLLLLSLYGCLLFGCNNTPTPQGGALKGSPANVGAPWALLPFVKADSANPVLTPGTASFICPVRKEKVFWEEKNVFNPAVAVRKDTLFLLYRAQDKIGKPGGTSRIGLAASTDGLHFTRMPQPVLYPDNDSFKQYEWEGGCEDPRVVEDSVGTYYMTYTAYDGKRARLLVATSTNLRHWLKHGPAFAKAYNGRYGNIWSKSGSIVSVYANGKITAAKINGKYWMYWGDKYIWAATSTDLINWQPVEKPVADTARSTQGFYGEYMHLLTPVLITRAGKFDSYLVESGPPAMLTPAGIVLLYNGCGTITGSGGQPQQGAYSSGQVLLDKNDPMKIIERPLNFFLTPDKPYEITGQVNLVCFIEGLAQYKNAWWLYYGTADSKIAVAVKR